MERVFALTITDTANFSKVEHFSIWHREEAARHFAKRYVYGLIDRDKHHGLGDTFNVRIDEHVVLD
jgi:hypothetical protein